MNCNLSPNFFSEAVGVKPVSCVYIMRKINSGC
jgi:hypothetical protein